MKLIVQIPCLNEEKTIGLTIQSIPRKIPGIRKVQVLIIDDGSNDGTVAEAKRAGADYIISLPKICGLAHVFMIGLEEALKLKADLIVNLDADNQYHAEDIPKLIQPILDKKAEIVIGDRQVHQIKHFSFAKRKLQALGSFLIRQVSGLPIRDAVSGFRAFSQAAALKINLRNHFSHTLETIIFASKERIPIASVPVTTNPTARPSRLAPSTWWFIKKSISSLIRVCLIYEPFKVFLSFGSILFVIGSIPIGRFLYFCFRGHAQGHIQSLVIGSIVMILGFISIAIGLIADLLSINRALIENQLLDHRRMHLGL